MEFILCLIYLFGFILLKKKRELGGNYFDIVFKTFIFLKKRKYIYIYIYIGVYFKDIRRNLMIGEYFGNYFEDYWNFI